MAKVLNAVSAVAGAIATVAALIPGGQTIAAIAGAVSAVTAIGAALLTKKPAARGSVNNVVIQSDAPQPAIFGRTYTGGVLRHDVGYGATLKKVPNPYRGMVVAYSGAGPIEEIEALQTDYQTVTFSAGAATGYFAGFMYTDTQLGELPESTALTPYFAGMTNWGLSHKLSGYAAALWNLKFDKKGKVFANGVPILGGIFKGVKCYDPRLDSTYPGGSGAHRIDDQTTWEWTDNPGLMAISYLYGWQQNGKRVYGVGLPVESIALEYFVALANLCDANGWTCGGVLYEPGDKWDNLKNILAAGSAEPIFSHGQISCRFNAPVVSLDTITAEDLTDEGLRVPGARPWGERINGVVPKYRSEDHNWNYVAAELVTDAAYVTMDGVEKNQEIQYNMCQDVDQAAQLAGYDLVNARELGPIEIVVKPRFRSYRPGEAITVDLPEYGLDEQLCLILTKTVDPATMKVSFTLRTETDSKHAYVLGLTGTAPPTPHLFDTEESDGVAAGAGTPAGYEESLIANSYTDGLTITGTDAGADASIVISNHDRLYADDDAPVAVTGATLTGKAFATKYWVYYDDPLREGGAVTYATTTTEADAYNSPTYPDRHHVGNVITPANGAADTSGNVSPPPGSSDVVAHTHVLADVTDVTASAAEVNILDGATLTTTELNYVDGVTSAIQTQLNAKQATITSASSLLGADVTLSVTDTFYDGPSVSLAAGTWFVQGQISIVMTTTGVMRWQGRITDGSTHYSSGQIYVTSNANNSILMHLSATITLGSTTTIKLQAAGSTGSANSLMKAATTFNSSGNNATQINAIKIA